MSVAPRWKRRADEIAEAIGDELSINGTVSVGNDVSLSVATITALANAITSVLNPGTIARAMWTSDIAGTHDARAVYTVDGGGYWSITAPGGVAGAAGSPIFIYQTDGTTSIAARAGLEDRHEDVIFLNNVWQLPVAIVRNVNVLSTIQQPVHVELKNVTGGFSALGVGVSNAMKLSPQPISIASTVNVKTATAESVAITGTVNANVGSVTLPISNPNNITVPVVNTNSVTVPVSLGSVTVPIKATTAGIPQNASGVSVFVPVDGNHSVTVPVSAGSTTVPASVPSGLTVPASVPSGLTVPVAVGSNTVPVAVGSATVPVSLGSVVVPVRTVTGTTNAADGTGAAVVVPVTASGTVIDVKIVEISATTPASGGVAPTTAFHEAVETALEDADGVVVDQSTAQVGAFYGIIDNYSSTHMRVKATNGITYNANSINIVGSSETVNRTTSSVSECEKLIGVRVFTYSTDYQSYARNWMTVESFPGGIITGVVHVTDPRIGHVWAGVNVSGTYVWTIQDSKGNHIANQGLLWENSWHGYGTVQSARFRGATVHRRQPHSLNEWVVVALAT